MNFRGCVCPICGRNFHACGSCELDYDWQYHYCSTECFILSDEYRDKMVMLSSFVHKTGMSIKEMYENFFYDDVLRDAAKRFKYYDDYMDFVTEHRKEIDDEELTNRMSASMVDTEGIENDEDTED